MLIRIIVGLRRTSLYKGCFLISLNTNSQLITNANTRNLIAKVGSEVENDTIIGITAIKI